ncbi:MAG: HEPN domain-containing protein [Candidatus Omnitrophica bacterium]|nr:HEPN domain-containing protein [Candidatus Omnitrophota bacterium]
MTPKDIKTVEVDRSQYLNYERKAEEFYRSMLYAEKSGYWNSVGLNAIHCAISMSDALLVKFSGTRSISSDHMVVVNLIKQNLNLKGINDKLATLRRILSKKSIVEYDSVVFTESDAAEVMKQAERFYLWAKEALNE